MATENIGLETIPSDPIAAAHAANRNNQKIDDAIVGNVDLSAVDVLDEAGGDPVEGGLATKLAAHESRIVTLEDANATIGDVASVDILDEADGDPVEGDLAAKLTALEARLVAVETAVA